MSASTVVLSFLVILVTRAIGQTDELYRCPSGLTDSVFAYNEKCYRFVSSAKHWNQAQSDCQVKGGNLVRIPDQATQTFIYNTVKSTLKWPVNGMWIGAHDQRVTERWEWVNGNPSTAGLSIGYKNWGSGQPSCGIICIEHCGQMRFDDYGRWHDVQCHARFLFNEERYRYCCMYDMGPKSTTTSTTTPAPTTTPATTVTTTATEQNVITEKVSTVENTTLVVSAVTSSTGHRTRGNDVAVDGDQPTRIVTLLGATRGAEKIESRDAAVTGGTAAGIAIGCLVALCLLLLLLLVFLRRRKQKKDTESPSENFQNQTYAGGMAAAGPGLAYVNPQAETATYLNPVLSVQMPEKSTEKPENPYSECMDNEHNACAAADFSNDDDDDMGYSKGVYEDIKLDPKDLSEDSDVDDFGAMKHKTPSVEYLHARHPPENSPAPIAVPPRNLYDEGREHMDNIYVPMETGNDPGPHYQ